MNTNRLLPRTLAFGLMGVLIVVLISATILEKLYGTHFAIRHIYASPIFILLWTGAAVSSLIWMLRRKIQRRAATFGIHLSLLIILAGALTTHLLGTQGTVHLRRDASPIQIFTLSDGQTSKFPFQVSLKEFHLEYYPGTFAPMDFVSTLLIHDEETHEGQVSMNHIYNYRHYRFYQSGYDKDGEGTTLAVSYDPYGIAVTYAGYLGLLLSMFIFFADRKSLFVELLHHPLLRRTVTACLLLGGLLSPTIIYAINRPQALPRHVAEEIGNLYVYYNDRICPLQTMARDFTVKLYGQSSYKGLTSEQVLTGWFFYYDDWKNEPMIQIKGKSVRQLLGTESKYVRLTDFIGPDGYKLGNALQEARQDNRRKLEDANEKFNLASMVSTGRMLKIYPYRDAEQKQLVWYSPADKLPVSMPVEQWTFMRKILNYAAEKIALGQYDEAIGLLHKIKEYQQKETEEYSLPSDSRFQAEKIYNRINCNRPLAMCCIVIGLLSFIFYCRSLTKQQDMPGLLNKGLAVAMTLILVYLVVIISLRGYVAGHLPISNGHETMQFMAGCTALLTLILLRRFSLILPFGFLLCGLTLLVSMLGEANPQITPLMPVLASPLLSLHVVVIMIAYSLLAFAMLNGVTAVVLHCSDKACATEIERLHIISRIILYPAVFLLCIGIFVGAVWANVSWGRYWGWDPKEVWALVTMLVYAMALHPTSLPWFRRPMFFHVFCIVAFLTVLVTYFGVNFLLGGMHSYAGG